MPRKGPAPRREYPPDPIYKSVLITQIVNKVLQRGKRTTAERIVYEAMTIIEQKTGAEPVSTVKRAVDDVHPQLEVKSRRVGGATYQVPMEVRPRRATTLAIRWLVSFSRDRREQDHRPAPGQRAARRQQRHRRGDEAQRQDGRVQQGLRPLPLVGPGGGGCRGIHPSRAALAFNP